MCKRKIIKTYNNVMLHLRDLPQPIVIIIIALLLCAAINCFQINNTEFPDSFKRSVSRQFPWNHSWSLRSRRPCSLPRPFCLLISGCAHRTKVLEPRLIVVGTLWYSRRYFRVKKKAVQSRARHYSFALCTPRRKILNLTDVPTHRPNKSHVADHCRSFDCAAWDRFFQHAIGIANEWSRVYLGRISLAPLRRRLPRRITAM